MTVMDQKNQNQETHQKNPNQQQQTQHTKPTPSHETHPTDKSNPQTGTQSQPNQSSTMGQDKR
jgi:hypothetical protein